MDDRPGPAPGLDRDPEAWVARLRPQLDADLMSARRRGSHVEVAAVVAAEIAERERAIAEYRSIRLDTTTLELELTTLERYRGRA